MRIMRIERNRDVTAIQYWIDIENIRCFKIINQQSTFNMMWKEYMEHDFSNREMFKFTWLVIGDNWWKYK